MFLTCPPSHKLPVLRTMTLPTFRSHYESDCPSQLAMPLSAGPPPQQPCQFSSLPVDYRLAAGPSFDAARILCVFCTPVVSTGACRMTFQDRSGQGIKTHKMRDRKSTRLNSSHT